MDVFYKLKVLHEAGIKVILHCFQYRDRQPQEALEQYCEKVYYYKRKLSPIIMLSTLPFIVASRRSSVLLKNLKKDDYPILFEGLHTCGIIDEKVAERAFQNRKDAQCGMGVLSQS